MPKYFNSRKIIITTLRLPRPLFTYMESTVNQCLGRTYVIEIEICRLWCTQFHPTPLKSIQADEMYYEDEGETGQKQSAEMYWHILVIMASFSRKQKAGHTDFSGWVCLRNRPRNGKLHSVVLLTKNTRELHRITRWAPYQLWVKFQPQ